MRTVLKAIGALTALINISTSKYFPLGQQGRATRALGEPDLSHGKPAATNDLQEFLRSERGLEVVEWLLVLGGVIVPLAALIYKVMGMVAQFYSFNSWIISLPFP